MMNRSMSQGDDEESKEDVHLDDDHDSDTVMPGFRFHPTEEELVEFYLRRKVEGKPFNVDLITFLDLYRYDPWELPGLAAIGEKEWYFYVPRDRKYRNGDRPNRVTTSGYWKATGADRMIRSENSLRSIGLKKTLVFYTGKAPKGVRTGWIMNEYRLPQHDTQRLQKGEISLCRVYKRPGVEFYPSLSRSTKQRVVTTPSNSKLSQSSPSSSATDVVGTNLALSHQGSSYPLLPMATASSDHEQRMISHEYKQQIHNGALTFFDDLHKLVNTCNDPTNNVGSLVSNYSTMQAEPPQPAPAQAAELPGNVVPASLQPAHLEKLWDWNAVLETGKDYTDLFK